MCSAGRNLTSPDVRQRARPRSALFAAHGQTFAALRAAALQDQTAVLGAHPHHKPVRLLPMTRVRLERALALHGFPSGENEPTMLANGFRECQSDRSVLESASSSGCSGRTFSMRVWSLPKVFHTCGKNCGKTPRSAEIGRFKAGMSLILTRAKAGKAVKMAFFATVFDTPPELCGFAAG